MKNLLNGIVSKAGKVITVKRALIAGGIIVGLAVIDYIANELKECDAELAEDLTADNVISIVGEEVNINPE
jgi:hypothetical protein